jgi:hypothetical protein
VHALWRAPPRWTLVTLGLLGSLLLSGCSRTARHTYHVTEAQLDQMRAIAGITPCPHGPTIFAGMKRAAGGGLVHIECPGRRWKSR